MSEIDIVTIGSATMDVFVECDEANIVSVCGKDRNADFMSYPYGSKIDMTSFATNIGENGIKLSGGQRQRLAIARSLYRNPEILILDEATSALDSQSEKFIKDTMVRLRENGKTIIVIAHRLGTITDANKIIVLEDGKVVGEGTHSDLINNSGHYKKLFSSQMTC